MQSEYTVSQVNTYIKNMFTQDFLLRQITIKGEVSNCKYHSSGHIYFTLKDKGAALSCVMFAGDAARGLSFRLEEGLEVKATGSVSVYERDGKYQLYARKIEKGGAGALYEKFEELKNRLKEQGMFDDVYKQPLPKYIRTLGVVTAPTGAAVRDIINVATRRNPHIQIILYPAIVQGERAAESIVRGIQTLSASDADVIIVGRGGGSIEDLWAFNEEIVAQAIFDCPIPIISAVGHETDTTIADFVSDRRAPTPSAAAEMAVFEYERFLQDLRDYSDALAGRMERKTKTLTLECRRYAEILKRLSPAGKIRDRLLRMDQYQDTLNNLMEMKLREKKHRLNVDIERLKGLSPLDRLKTGYSYVCADDGKNIRSIDDVSAGDALEVFVSDGLIRARCEGTEEVSFLKGSGSDS